MGASPHESALPRFLIELRDRDVYQTGVAYLAGAFLVWQAADIMLPALGFPPSAMTFLVVTALAGFPVALVLSWLFRLVPERPAATEPAPSSDDRTAGRGRKLWRMGRRAAVVVVASGVFVACAGVTWTVVPRAKMSLGESHEVLVADMANHTGESVFDGSLTQALEVGLAQSPHLSLVPRARLAPVLAEMRRASDEPLDEATAVEVALRSNLHAVLAPSIDRFGERYRLTTRLIDPATGRMVIARTATASSPEDVLAALDDLARQLRADLGEPLRSMVGQSVSLDRATTSSLEALKAWTEGHRQWDAGHQAQAGVLYQQAVELDSTFAIAWADLAQYYYWGLGDIPGGAERMATALRHAEHVTELERLRIQAKAAEWREDRETAAEIYRTLTAMYPGDMDAWGNLGYQYLRLQRYEEGIEALERSLAIDSLQAHGWLNLATMHSANGECDTAAVLYGRAFTLQPNLRTLMNVNHEWGFNFLAAGRWSEAEAAFRLMLDGSLGERSQGHRSLGELRMAKGRFDEAAEHFREAVLLSHTVSAPTSELRNRTLLIEARYHGGHGLDGTWPEAYALAVRNYVPTYYVAILAIWYARAGRLDRAAELRDTAAARASKSRFDRMRLEHLAGEIAIARGEAGVAAEHLRAALAMNRGDAQAGLVLSGVLQTQGDTAGAEAQLRQVLAGTLQSNESLVPTILAYHRLAVLLDRAGREEEAAPSYRRFLGFWGRGNADLPEVEEARRRLRAIEGA